MEVNRNTTINEKAVSLSRQHQLMLKYSLDSRFKISRTLLSLCKHNETANYLQRIRQERVRNIKYAIFLKKVLNISNISTKYKQYKVENTIDNKNKIQLRIKYN